MRTALLVALAIFLWVGAFAPLDLGFFAFAAMVPWCFLVRIQRRRKLFWLGYFIGVMILSIGCSWLARTHLLNLALMVLIEALFFAAFATVLRFLLVRRRMCSLIAVPSALVVMEFVRCRFPSEGFPWLLLGYSQHDSLSLLQLSDITGVFGLSFLVAMASGAVDDFIHQRGRRRWLSPAVFAGTLLAALGYGQVRLRDDLATQEGPFVALVQANIEQKLKVYGNSREQILMEHVRPTGTLNARHEGALDLVVWPETMVPYRMRHESSQEIPADLLEFESSLGEVARQLDVGFLVGVETVSTFADTEDFKHWNSAIYFDADGNRVATYDKSVLVPGGEFLPYLDWFPDWFGQALRDRIRSMAGFVPDLSPGAGPVVIEVPVADGAFDAGITICYEICYPSVFREYAALGADFCINLSNEAWFYDSAEFDQYTAMAAFRAAENKRSMIRSANSGTSGFLDPWGRVRALEDSAGRRHGFAGTLTGKPVIANTTTIYNRWGDWVAGLCAVLLVIGLTTRRLSWKQRLSIPRR